MTTNLTIAYKRDRWKSVLSDFLIISYLDNAIVDHVVPHDRSISRNVPKCPNGLRTKILKIDTPPVASIKQAPKKPVEQNIGERKFKAPQN